MTEYFSTSMNEKDDRRTAAGMLTERHEISRIKPGDKADYFKNISNNKKVLETFVCTYSDSFEAFDDLSK